MKKIFLATLIVLAAIVTSCNDNLNLDASSDGEVLITSDITTRVIGTQWEANDAIGVYMTSTGGSLGSLGENVEYVTAIGDGNFTSTDPLYYPESGRVDFLAYYPYVDDATFDATAYSVNVSSQTDLSAIDLMTATATNVAKSSAAVNLAFYHKLSNIVLTVSPGDDWTASDLVGLSVKLVGTDTEATYNLESDDITFGGSSEADITLNITTDGASAEAIVIPQILYDAKFSFTTATGTTIELVIPTAAFMSGSQYVYDVTIDGSGVKFNNSTIDGWGNGDEGATSTYPSLQGTEYYPFILDDYSYAEIADRVVYDFRSNDVDRFLYQWDDTYTFATASGLNSYGNDGGYLALICGTSGWAGCGLYVDGAKVEATWNAIYAAPDEYYLHMAFKSTANYSHCFYILDVNDAAAKIGVGPTSVYDATVMYDFTRDGEWHEIEVPLSELDLSGFTPSDDDVHVFVSLTEGVYGADLNLDAVFIYKK